MLGMERDEEFYMDDEPVEDVLRAFERGDKFLTAPPSRRARTLYLDVASSLVTEPVSRPFGESVIR